MLLAWDISPPLLKRNGWIDLMGLSPDLQNQMSELGSNLKGAHLCFLVPLRLAVKSGNLAV